MPNFQYRCIDQEGKVQTGASEAPSEAELEEQLAASGLWLIEADAELPKSNARRFRWPWEKVSRRDLIQFSIQFSTQLDAGVPLMNALEVTADECENAYLQEILHDVYRNVESGAALHQAMGAYPHVFPTEILSLIRAGEMSGQLPETFTEIRKHLEWVDQVMGDIKQASIYPAFIFLTVILFVLILFTFVIPKFVKLLNDLKVDLPLVTQIIFGVSDFIKATWWIWFGLIILGPVIIGILRRKSPGFAFHYDNLKLKLPVFGELNQMIALSRFSHNMASLFRAGVPILEAVELCKDLVGNQVVRQALRQVEQDLQQGESMAKSLGEHPVINRMVVRMVAVGENTGQLDQVLESVSKFYNETIPRQVKKVFAVMEPMTILALVGIVGLVAFAVFLPILSLMQNI